MEEPKQVCRAHARPGIAVPGPGLAAAAARGAPGEGRPVTPVTLITVATGVLIVLALPGQDGPPARPDGRRGVERADTARPAVSTGVLHVLRPTVTVLMIRVPGPTTGA